MTIPNKIYKVIMKLVPFKYCTVPLVRIPVPNHFIRGIHPYVHLRLKWVVENVSHFSSAHSENQTCFDAGQSELDVW